MKKLLLVSLVFVAALAAPVAHAQFYDAFGNSYATQAEATAADQRTSAQSSVSAPPSTPSGFTAIAPIPGLTDDRTTSVMNSNNLAKFFNNLYKYLIGLAAILAIIEIIWGGFEIATKDSVAKKTDGKHRVYQALFGLLLVLAPVIVFTIINPAILNLSVALSPLTLDAPAPSTSTPLPTQQTPISDIDKKAREAAGGQVVWSFSIPSNVASTPITLGQTLDAKQQQCTQETGGKGVILPSPQMGGGNFIYVCQTCPPNTSVILFPKGKIGSGPRGGCRAN